MTTKGSQDAFAFALGQPARVGLSAEPAFLFRVLSSSSRQRGVVVVHHHSGYLDAMHQHSGHRRRRRTD